MDCWRDNASVAFCRQHREVRLQRKCQMVHANTRRWHGVDDLPRCVIDWAFPVLSTPGVGFVEMVLLWAIELSAVGLEVAHRSEVKFPECRVKVHGNNAVGGECFPHLPVCHRVGGIRTGFDESPTFRTQCAVPQFQALLQEGCRCTIDPAGISNASVRGSILHVSGDPRFTLRCPRFMRGDIGLVSYPPCRRITEDAGSTSDFPTHGHRPLQDVQRETPRSGLVMMNCATGVETSGR